MSLPRPVSAFASLFITHSHLLLANNTRAVIRAHILDMCRRKLATFERFNAQYPGFGGFLPWFHTDAATGGLAPQPPHWVDAVPSLDNGEMLWTMLALVHALRTTGEMQLADGYCVCLFHVRLIF